MDVIYLDHNSTTPLAPEAAAAMQPWLGEMYGNPASQHQVGRVARRALEAARDDVARMLGARLTGLRPDRVIFTSGGTEANNLAILGLTGWRRADVAPGEVIISAIEHASITSTADLLEQSGWKVHRLGVSPNGTVDLEQLDQCLHAGTRLVSIMLANNETGVIQPIAEIARRCAALGVALHTDAAQAVGKIAVDFQSLGTSALSVAAHKLHGPLGIGALLVRGDLTVQPLLAGGFQQEGLRPGTESVMLAVGLQAAMAAAEREGAERRQRMAMLRDRLETGLREACGIPIEVNGAAAERLPNTLNVGFVGIDRQALLMALDLAGVACSTGSACASGSSEPSPVLAAMGAAKGVLDGSLRFSLGAPTTIEQIDEAIGRIAQACLAITGKKPVASSTGLAS